MSFILSRQRDGSYEEMLAHSARYREYLAEVRETFPPQAFELASSEWYYDFSDHRCPHDGWLEDLVITEPAEGERHEKRIVSIKVRLLGAYHDGHIELRYPRVYNYRIALVDGLQGHGDWRYDEFRLGSDGHVIHEIEWAMLEETANWLIEASDVEFSWFPLEDSSGVGQPG